jgi:AmmeMemoRadiSam system protein A
LAKTSILEEFGQGDPKKVKLDDEQFGQKRACFVTLKMDDELRGCIGSIIPHRSLADDIISNAKSAAFQDPRFSPLSEEEIKQNKLNIGITILSPTENKTFKTPSDLYSFLEKEQCGLIIEYGYR